MGDKVYDVWVNGVWYHGESVDLDTALEDCHDLTESRLHIYDGQVLVDCHTLEARKKQTEEG